MKQPCGFVLLNKTAGPTTFKILSPLKRHFRKIKVGHAGTLDSEASGLVIAAVGSATRLLQYAEALEKSYEFRWHLGRDTVTGEFSGEILEENLAARTDFTTLEKILPEFRGRIEQTPPLYSAVKIDGQRASDLARKGVVPELKKRQVDLFEFEAKEKPLGSFNSLDFSVRCSKGTYVRSLGRDLGKKLGYPACVSNIHRTAIGNHSLKEAISWEEGNFDLALISPEKFLGEFPTITLAANKLTRLRNGNPTDVDLKEGMAFIKAENEPNAEIFGEVVANRFQPKVVFQ